jgi:signal transduction histidine kinase
MTDVMAPVKPEQLEHDLVLAKEAAEKASQAKSAFIARMSHELRTPLNAVLGFAQLLALDDLSQEQAQSVQHILRAGGHLLKLIDEVLDVSKIETGTMVLAFKPIDLVALLNETISLMQPLAKTHGVSVKLEPSTLTRGDPSHHTVTADEQRLKQVMLNLLSNSIKYNRPNGQVRVSYQSLDGHLARIEICDTGVGISAERIKLLFTPFERLGAEQTDIEGNGIGLTLSKHLVEAMHGQLTLQSSEGQGTTALVDLPHNKV